MTVRREWTVESALEPNKLLLMVMEDELFTITIKDQFSDGISMNFDAQAQADLRSAATEALSVPPGT